MMSGAPPPARVLTVFLVLALVVSAVFFAASGREIKSDAWLYYFLAVNVSEGRGYVMSPGAQPDAPLSPYMGREPLYSLVLGAIFAITGPSLVVVFLLQVVLLALTGFVTFLIGRDITGSARFGVALGAITSTFPTLANYTVMVYREVFFTCLVAVAVYATMRAFASRRPVAFTLAGVAWGLATLCRAVVLPLPVLLLVFYAVTMSGPLRTRLGAVKASVGMLLGMALVLAPWVVRNAVVFGEPGLTPRSGMHLYLRASRTLLTEEELKMYAVYAVSETFANRLYPGRNLRSVGEGFFYREASEHIQALRRQGFVGPALEERAREEAIDLITTYPGRYVLTGLIELVKFNAFFHLPLFGDRFMEERFAGSFVLPAVRGITKGLGFLWLLLVLPGCVLLWRRGWPVVILIVLYFNVLHVTVDSIGRYSVPVIPYYLLLGSATLALVWQRRGAVAPMPLLAAERLDVPVSGR